MYGVDFTDALNEWLEQVSKLANLTPDQQTNITKAGAEIYKEKLEQATKSKHYSSHDDKTYGHMADNITFQGADIDGKKTGISSVGWNNHYHAMNAMRLNDGTKSIRADHFVTELQDSEKVKNEVLMAEKNEYEKLVKKVGGD
jgi:hypothetical protein